MSRRKARFPGVGAKGNPKGEFSIDPPRRKEMKETFGTRFARLRKEKGLTQDFVAEKANVSPQAVSKWENDINMPDITLLPMLSDLLGVTTDELLGKETVPAVRMLDASQKKPFEQMLLRIVVDSKDGDKVRVNLPLSLVKICLETGLSMPEVSGNKATAEALSNIDWQQMFSLIEKGVIGELVSVQSADGDNVSIVVE